jgi:hypothetical protein
MMGGNQMAKEEELDDHGRHPRRWTISAVTWTLENPDYESRIFLGVQIENPAEEVWMTKYLETVEAPDFERAVAAGHELLDRHAHAAGEFSLEIYVTPPQLPHPEQGRLGIRDYKVTPEALKQARAIGLRGRDLEGRIARLARHSVPFEQDIANRRFRGVILKIEDGLVSWINLAVPPRRRRRKPK